MPTAYIGEVEPGYFTSAQNARSWVGWTATWAPGSATALWAPVVVGSARRVEILFRRVPEAL
jgi:hypothetical protein